MLVFSKQNKQIIPTKSQINTYVIYFRFTVSALCPEGFEAGFVVFCPFPEGGCLDEPWLVLFPDVEGGVLLVGVGVGLAVDFCPFPEGA